MSVPGADMDLALAISSSEAPRMPSRPASQTTQIPCPSISLPPQPGHPGYGIAGANRARELAVDQFATPAP